MQHVLECSLKPYYNFVWETGRFSKIPVCEIENQIRERIIRTGFVCELDPSHERFDINERFIHESNIMIFLMNN